MNIIIILCLLIILATLIMGIITIINKYNINIKLIEKQIELEKTIYNRNITIDGSMNLMKTLVKDTLNEWQIYNVHPENYNYMTEKDIEDAKQFVINKICERMTPNIKEILSVAYNVDDVDLNDTSKQNIVKSILIELDKQLLDITITRNKNSDQAVSELNTIQNF